jgi:hypothetical protein
VRESNSDSRFRIISKGSTAGGFTGTLRLRRRGSAMSICSSTDLLSQPLAIPPFYSRRRQIGRCVQISPQNERQAGARVPFRMAGSDSWRSNGSSRKKNRLSQKTARRSPRCQAPAFQLRGEKALPWRPNTHRAKRVFLLVARRPSSPRCPSKR